MLLAYRLTHSPHLGSWLNLALTQGRSRPQARMDAGHATAPQEPAAEDNRRLARWQNGQELPCRAGNRRSSKAQIGIARKALDVAYSGLVADRMPITTANSQPPRIGRTNPCSLAQSVPCFRRARRRTLVRQYIHGSFANLEAPYRLAIISGGAIDNSAARVDLSCIIELGRSTRDFS